MSRFKSFYFFSRKISIIWRFRTNVGNWSMFWFKSFRKFFRKIAIFRNFDHWSEILSMSAGRPLGQGVCPSLLWAPPLSAEHTLQFNDITKDAAVSNFKTFEEVLYFWFLVRHDFEPCKIDMFKKYARFFAYGPSHTKYKAWFILRSRKKNAVLCWIEDLERNIKSNCNISLIAKYVNDYTT
jgi:hypothetical protein